MATPSCGSQNPGYQPACLAPTGSDTLQPPPVAAPGKRCEEGAEARRVKNFTGQHTFQAPAADDFIKGMLPHGQLPASHAPGLRPLRAVMGAMVAAIKGLWQETKPTWPGSRKAD